MELTSLLMNQIASMLLMGFTGFLAARAGKVTEASSKAVSQICVYIIMPCSLIKAFQTPLVRERILGLLLALLAALAIHGVFFLLTALIGRTKRPLSPEERASVIYNNSGNLGIPMVTSTLGGEYVLYLCAYLAVQSFLMWTHGQTLISGERKIRLRKVLLNPRIISLSAGVALFLFQVELSGPVGTAVNSIGNCLSPVTMMILGILMANIDLKEMLSNRTLYRVVLLRLIVYPLAILPVLMGLTAVFRGCDSEKICMTLLICSIGPTASTIAQMTQIYNHPNNKYISGINVVSTLLCTGTMPLMCTVYQGLISWFL